MSTITFIRLSRRLAAAEAQLGKLAAGLNTVESRVAQLQKELAEHTRGAAELQLRTESTEASLSTARALLQKLDTEHRDWQTQFQELTDRKEKLDIEAANAATLLVYQVRDQYTFYLSILKIYTINPLVKNVMIYYLKFIIL